jgi:hypothetical protein
MKVRPDGFVPALGAQWLCAALDLLLGERDLSNAPALLVQENHSRSMS